MKIRQGFVSNSSSTSFYINASKHSCEKVKEVLDRLIDVLNFCHGGCYSSRTMYDLYETEDVKTIELKIFEFTSMDGSIFSSPEKIKNLGIFPEKIVVIDSAGDNSIPYSIQEFLQDEMGAIRQHWG